MNDRIRQTVVLGGFCLLAIITIGSSALAGYLVIKDHPVPTGLTALVSSSLTFCVNLLKDYMGVKE